MKTQEETKIVTFEERVKERALDHIMDCEGIQGSELHNRLFNEDYFVIGHYRAEQMLIPYGVFQAIGDIQEYEKEQFGEVSTDLGQAEKVANMLAYIIGEKLLNDCQTIQDKWDKDLTLEDLEAIKQEIEDANI